MNRIEYFRKVSFPLWWKDCKTVLYFMWGALLFFVFAVPIGFVINKVEKWKKKRKEEKEEA